MSKTAAYPLAREYVARLRVGDVIPNTNSIAATFGTSYVILPGVRSVPMQGLHTAPTDLFYAADDLRRVEELAKQIKASRRIDPLIVAVDVEGPYILEGAHRLGALHLLGAKRFPALVVLER